MKRASYREGIEWIAYNDEPLNLTADDISGFVSTLLLADLFHVSPARVASDVLSKRLKNEKRRMQDDNETNHAKLHGAVRAGLGNFDKF